MTLKTYQASTMAECLVEVKRDLGRDAVILNTRTVRRPGLLGLFRPCIWEVTASRSVNVPRRMREGQYVAEPAARRIAPEEPARKPLPLAPEEAQAPAEEPPEADEGSLSRRVNDIHRMLKDLLSRPPRDSGHGPAIAPQLEEFHRHLLTQDIGGEAVSELIQQLCMNLTGQQLGERQLIRDELLKRVAERIRTVGESDYAPPRQTGRPHVIALVGPTGVGKTTTIAKLAANYKLHQHKRVGLITMDTYRIAAVEQLRTYANIIDVPIQAVLTTGELEVVLENMQGLEVILMDTAGRSQNNRLRLSQLRSFVVAAGPHEVHLVVSATANRSCTLQVLERFLPLGANRLIVTKLDEAAAFGVLLNVSVASGLPLSYVTTGQDVPEDIMRAHADMLAECIVNGRFGEEVDVA